MNRLEAADYALGAMKKLRADKVQVTAILSEKDEITVDTGKFSLFRTTIDPALSLKAIKDNRVGATRLNTFDKEAIDKALEELKGLIEAGSPDPAHDIGPKASGKFEFGPQAPDQEKMLDRTQELLDGVKAEHPKVLIRSIGLTFIRSETTLLNSNGTELHSKEGVYGFGTGFSGQEDGKSSSFNWASGQMINLESPFLKNFGMETLLRQAAEQVHTKSIPEKFMGDIIVTPQCLPSLLGGLLGQLGDQSLIAGTSLFRDKLGERIASPLLNISSEVRHMDFASHEFFDGQGFLSEDMPILSEGVLKTFLLSLYGANKTGKAKAKSSGGNLVVGAGDKSLEELISSTKQGILLCRYSGGRPQENGDFSGVAKNSYYIADGKVQFPVSETMVSGNLEKLFQSIKGISKERINSGHSLYPWMQMSGVTVSGK